jgi:hypothetical protein
LIALYENHAEHRDQFAVFAIHDHRAKSFADLDKKLVNVKKEYWQGKDLPFPVLLDATGETEKRYGIEGFPTGLLIDPEGRFVGLADAAELEAKLPAIPAGKRWASYRDIQTNISWAFEPSKDTLGSVAQAVSRNTGCTVDIDADAVKAAGLTPADALPGALFGNPVTLRSVEALLLYPHGLRVVASADGTKLLIGKRASGEETESYFQKLRNGELAKRLDERGSAKEGKHRLEIKDKSLIEAVKLISQEFDLPIALDAGAMRMKTLDPYARVSGSIGGGELRKSLEKMLEALGLGVEVRDEVVLVTPKRRTTGAR